MGLLSRIREFGRTLNIFRRCLGKSNRISPMDMPDTDDEREEIVHVFNILPIEEDIKAKIEDRTPSIEVTVARPLPPVIRVKKVKKVKKSSRNHESEKITNPTNDINDPAKLQVSEQQRMVAKSKRKGKKKSSSAKKCKHSKNTSVEDASESHNIIRAMIRDDSVSSTSSTHGVTSRNTVKRKADKRKKRQRDNSEDRSLRAARSSPQPINDDKGHDKQKAISSHSLSSDDVLLPGEITNSEMLNMVESYKTPVIRETTTDRILYNWMERKLKEDKEADNT